MAGKLRELTGAYIVPEMTLQSDSTVKREMCPYTVHEGSRKFLKSMATDELVITNLNIEGTVTVSYFLKLHTQ